MLRIEIGVSGRKTKVFLEGQDIGKYLNGVEVSAQVSDLTSATLHYRGAVVVEGEAGSITLQQEPIYVECRTCGSVVGGEKHEPVKITASQEQ